MRILAGGPGFTEPRIRSATLWNSGNNAEIDGQIVAREAMILFYDMLRSFVTTLQDDYKR